MNNPFQEQLLKAGLVTKQQVQKVKQDKNKKYKQKSKKDKVVDETRLKAQQATEDKAKRDKELNQRKEQQAQQKAISIEINQLISNNSLPRDETYDIAYNFEHNKKIKSIYVNEDIKQQIIKGKLGIARIEGRYEIVPLSVAEKIQQRNAKRVVLFEDNEQATDEDDAYAEHQIPDDLIW